ncbi:MAG: alpha/beta fold hydrolase [Candidatus Nanopelagicales bacterium]|nr:alpha/beta fold hydrolase [Candidatus Nanopelagicales bacterium]
MPLQPYAKPHSHDGNQTGVIVCHGFTGSPKSVRPWAEYLSSHGLTVRAPRLPGHGTRWQDMNVTTWEDWYAEVERTFRELRDRCETVFACGLSMGGTLSLRLAEENGDELTGLVLVNPAVHSERPDRFLLPILKHVIPAFPGICNDIKKPGQDEGAYPKLPLRAAASLMDLWGKVRGDITKVNQPTLLFRSVDDHVVEPSNAAWILANISSPEVQEVVLTDSYHVATLDNDAETIFTGSLEFINRVSGQSATEG